ncbi:hypothetical protein GCM10029992_62450 [Glycomyces albus]
MLSVDPEKPRRTADQLGDAFSAERTDELRYPIALHRPEALRLVAMGPSARHLDASALAEAVGGLPDPIEVTVSATVTRWRRRNR